MGRLSSPRFPLYGMMLKVCALFSFFSSACLITFSKSPSSIDSRSSLAFSAWRSTSTAFFEFSTASCNSRRCFSRSTLSRWALSKLARIAANSLWLFSLSRAASAVWRFRAIMPSSSAARACRACRSLALSLLASSPSSRSLCSLSRRICCNNFSRSVSASAFCSATMAWAFFQRSSSRCVTSTACCMFL